MGPFKVRTVIFLIIKVIIILNAILKKNSKKGEKYWDFLF
jgi:hypothetical protein